MSKQTDVEGQTTRNMDDKHPYRRKVQRAKTNELFLKKPQRIRAVKAKKHLTISPIKERRKNLELNERKQVTRGEFVYKRCETSGYKDKWYKLYKGEKREDAIKIRGHGHIEAILVDSPPKE